MKVHCSVEKLKNAVILANRMTGKNLTLVILHSIVLTAKGKTIKIRSTNLTVGIEIEIPADIEIEGIVVINGDVVANICTNLPISSTITLTLQNDNLTIQSNKTVTLIKSFPSEEFPALPIIEGENFEIKSSILYEAIRSVYFASAVSDIKPEISSIYIYSEEGVMYIVATDSFRLAEKKIVIKNIPDISKILIPYKNVADLLRVLEVCTDTIYITYTRNQITFRGSTIYFTSRLIDGGFPPYQLIIPKEETTKVIVIKQDLITSLKLSTIFTDKFFQVIFTITPHNKQISITSKNSDIGSSVSILDSVIEGEEIEIVCNLKYFLDVFQSLSGDSVSLSFTKPTKPIVIKSVQDKNFLYLLMPTNR